MYSQTYWSQYNRSSGRQLSHYSSEPVLIPHVATTGASGRLDDMMMFHHQQHSKLHNGSLTDDEKLPPILDWHEFRSGQYGFHPPQSQVQCYMNYMSCRM